MGRGMEEGVAADRMQFRDTGLPPKRETADEEDPLKDFRPSDTAVSVVASPPSKSQRYQKHHRKLYTAEMLCVHQDISRSSKES